MKKVRLLHTLLILTIAVFLSSCTTMLYTSIDILRPAKVSFPSDITKVVLINNAPVQHPDVGHTTTLLNQQERKVRFATDSVSVYCLAALAEGMAGKEFFNRVSLEPNTINQSNLSIKPTLPDREFITSVASRNSANAVISLNQIVVASVQGEVYSEETNSFISYIEAIYETHWSTHFPDKNKVQTFSARDTVFWESEAYSRQRASQGLPDRYNALIDGALITGQRNLNRFIPWWDKVDRYLFNSSSKSIKPGMEAFYRKKWKEATDAWSNALAYGKNESMNGRLAHNLAVAWEIQGNLQQAKSFSDKALEYFMSSFVISYDQFMLVVGYNEELEKRIKEVETVNQQLGE